MTHIILLLLLVLPLTAFGQGGYDRIEVLSVGIGTYTRGAACAPGRGAPKGQWCNLPNGHVDAINLDRALRGGRWLAPMHSTVLPEAQATRSGILRALRAAAKRAKAGNGLLVFSFTGHGKTLGNAGFIIPRDARVDDPDSWLSMANLKSVLYDQNRTVMHQMLVLGSCFSGRLFRGDDDRFAQMANRLPNYAVANARWIRAETHKKARITFTAGTADERIPDGQPGEGSGYGNALATAFQHLNGATTMAADANFDHCLTHLELASWLKNQGQSEANSPQFGNLGRQKGQGTVLFCEHGAGSQTAPVSSPQQVRGEAVAQPGVRLAPSTPGRPALHRLPAGSFFMGSPASDTEGGNDERPQHRVTLTHAIAMMATEVTQAQYTAVMGSNPAHFAGCTECPVETVSWLDAAHYANTLSAQEGRPQCYRIKAQTVTWPDPKCPGYRLPTEAEWEYAARAGSTGMRYGPIDGVAWYSTNAGGKTHPVGGKAANAWGLHGMLGGVWEWIWDSTGSYGSDAVENPRANGGFMHVSRGGSWKDTGKAVRSAYRGMGMAHFRFSNQGFRLCRGLPD